MIYIHRFSTVSDFNTAYNGNKYIEPWLSVTDGQGLNYSKVWPEVTILRKEQQSDGYRYTTSPALYSLIPKADWFNGGSTYKVYFNGVLFTSNAKNTWAPGSYSDESRNYFRMAANSNYENYKYYFFAYITDDNNISTNNGNDPDALLPDSFGEVGDKIRVRIEKN